MDILLVPDKNSIVSVKRQGACLCRWAGPLCIVAGCASLLTAVSTTHWLEYIDRGSLLVHGGLFLGCLPQMGGTCRSWDNTPFETFDLKIASAALIFAAIGYVISCLIVTYFLCHAVRRSSGSPCYLLFWIVVLSLNVVGLCFFRAFHRQKYTMVNLKYYNILSDMHYGYSFHLAWGALMLEVLGAAVSWFNISISSDEADDDDDDDEEEEDDTEEEKKEDKEGDEKEEREEDEDDGKSTISCTDSTDHKLIPMDDLQPTSDVTPSSCDNPTSDVTTLREIIVPSLD